MGGTGRCRQEKQEKPEGDSHKDPAQTHEARERYQSRFGYTGDQGIDHAEVGSGKRQPGSITPRSRRLSIRTSAGRSNPAIVLASAPRSNPTSPRPTSPHKSRGRGWPEKSQITVRSSFSTSKVRPSSTTHPLS